MKDGRASTFPILVEAVHLPEAAQPERCSTFSISHEILIPTHSTCRQISSQSADEICMAQGLPFASFERRRTEDSPAVDSPTRRMSIPSTIDSASHSKLNVDPRAPSDPSETKGSLLLVLFFLVEAARIFVDAWVLYDDGAIVQPVLVAQSCISVLVGLFFSCAFSRSCGSTIKYSLRMIFSLRDLYHCLPVAACFCFSQLLIGWSYVYGLDAATSIVLGNLYLPLCAFLSQRLFDRRYGRLDTLALSMLTLCSFTFGELRNAELGHRIKLRRRVLMFSIASTTLSCFASLFAERRMKTKYNPAAVNVPFFIQMARFQIGVLMISFCVLLVMQEGLLVSPKFRLDFKFMLLVCLRVAQGWIGGLFAKTFSNMAKAVTTNLSFLVIYFVGDLILYGTTYSAGFDGAQDAVRVDRFTVSALACLVALIALLYQVGRSQSKHERVAALLRATSTGCRFNGGLQLGKTLMRLSSQLSFVTFFILADAGRTVLKEWFWRQECSKSITPQTVVVAGSLLSVCIGSIVSLSMDGFRGLRNSLSPSQTLRCLPVAACFSLAQTFTTLAFSYKLSGLANTALGFSYMPLIAILAKCVFKRSYTALEWLSLMLIMLSAFVFVQLQRIGKDLFGHVSESNTASDDEHSGLAILCCFASVVFACIGSMVAEKIMKTSDMPFYQQKTYMDLGCLVAAIIMLFLLGFFDARTQDQSDWDSKAFIPEPAFWKERKIRDGSIAPSPPAGWGWEAAITVLIELIHAWTGGLVAKKLSSVDKAVAQSVSLLIVYFVGELVVKHVDFWWPVGTMSFVMALSVLLFTHASMASRVQPEIKSSLLGDSSKSCSGMEQPEANNTMLDDRPLGA